MKFNAYWIHIKGYVVPVPMTHIEAVILTPELFGYTRELIQEIYARHGEPMPIEGKARLEIMLNLIKVGWIRLRYNKRQDLWVVELHTITREIEELIKQFFCKPVFIGQNSDIKITELFNAAEVKRHVISMNQLRTMKSRIIIDMP
ncbi:MAG: hypothetical protein WCG31_03645 [Deltaproteobacteria bacterium]